MFELRDFSAFKQHARDFLVQTKSFADKDNAELFAEEATAMREVPSRCPEHGGCMELDVVVELRPSQCFVYYAALTRVCGNEGIVVCISLAAVNH